MALGEEPSTLSVLAPGAAVPRLAAGASTRSPGSTV